jgi:hypothetical protein
MLKKHCADSAEFGAAGWPCGESVDAIPGAVPGSILFHNRGPGIPTLKPGELARELAFPLTQPAILLAMIFFWLLLSIAKYAGLYGMFLRILLLPAYLRYLLDILDARANGRQPEAPTADMFSLYVMYAFPWGRPGIALADESV